MSLEGVFPTKGTAWFQKHRREAIDLAALAVSLLLVRLFVTDVPAYAALSAFVVAALVPLRPYAGAPSKRKEFISAIPRQVAAVVVTGALLRYLLGQPLTSLWFGAIWPFCAYLLRLNHTNVLAGLLRLKNRLLSPVREEVFRIGLLVASALWLTRGFERDTLHGGSDALWYGLNLADALTQVRSGIFPVFVGQSLYQFNGAFCPIRVAPAFHYLGILLDAVTFHRLGTFALQNLLMSILGAVGMLTAYLGLRSLMPAAKWTAAGLAALFLSCPGVLGIPYNGDLYMTWTTLPLVSLVWLATVKSFLDRGRMGTMLLLGASLGLCWWGHSPIALWSTLIAGAAQALRIISGWRDGIAWTAIAACGLIFAAIAAYPVGSVLFFTPESHAQVNLVQEGSVINIVYANNQVMPEALLPLSYEGRALSDFQLGYSLWALLLFLLYLQVRSFRLIAAMAAVTAVILALLLVPISRLNPVLWSLVPGFVRDVTGNWAMTRLYLPLAAATVFGIAACVATGGVATRMRRVGLSVLVALGCVWSFLEASKFADGSRILSKPSDSALDPFLPENVPISRYSYSLFPDFPKHPSTFTHGVTDPSLENRLLSADMLSEIATNKGVAKAEATVVATGAFRWGADGFRDHATLDTPIRIEPGKSYLLSFDFANPEDLRGVLQIKGEHFFRQYGLPTYGGSLSFGVGGTHAHEIPLWTTSGAEELTFRFFPSAAIPGKAWPDVAQVRLLSYERAALPVRVESWIPYRAKVESPAPAWLETPRMYQSNYSAWVDGKPAEVRKSPESLVAVKVPSGRSSVELVYVAPLGLKLLFWLSTTTILGSGIYWATRINVLRKGPLTEVPDP
jgi:hypothetical protein